MALPSITAEFTTAASTVVQRSGKGVVAAILRDATKAVQGEHIFTDVADLPAEMTEANKVYIRQIFSGAEMKPSKVLCAVLPDTALDFGEATEWLATQTFNWLVGPPDCTAEEALALAEWIAVQRLAGRHYKGVLPHIAADDYAISNFDTDDIAAGGNVYAAAGYCGRIAGIIAGTPLTSSVTFIPLPEVTAVKQLTRKEMDDADGAGKLILFHDGTKVKLGRGVTSATTLTGVRKALRKIKTVETVDMISEDITRLGEDVYIGRYVNSYDNKQLLVTAIKGYFRGMETDGILSAGSTVEIDADAVREYLKSQGTDVSDMSADDLRTADTGDRVYIVCRIRILDAIEDIVLKIAI